MKVITWNVNSLRARLPRTLALLDRHKPDVLCLQETKLTDEAFPEEPFRERGYHVEAHGQKSYNGVAIVSREPLEDVTKGFPGDPAPEQSRVIAGTVGGIRVVNLYVVNGKSVEHPDYALKLAWLDALDAWLCAVVEPESPLLVVGDYNVAPADIDVHDPELWRGQNLCSDAERERFAALFKGGLRDLFRECYPEEQKFTWWDYRNGAFHKNLGLRIDLALGTRPLAERCKWVEVDREERKPSTGEGKPSDHAPLVVHLDWP